MTLANLPARPYSHLASANSEVGIGVPKEKADTPPLSGFFVSAAWPFCFMGGPCVGAFGHAGPFPGTPTRTALPSRIGVWEAGSEALKRTLSMTKRRILTLNPSKARAAYHRACALAALHADSSLPVRLARYKEAMERARAIEALLEA